MIYLGNGLYSDSGNSLMHYGVAGMKWASNKRKTNIDWSNPQAVAAYYAKQNGDAVTRQVARGYNAVSSANKNIANQFAEPRRSMNRVSQRRLGVRKDYVEPSRGAKVTDVRSYSPNGYPNTRYDYYKDKANRYNGAPDTFTVAGVNNGRFRYAEKYYNSAFKNNGKKGVYKEESTTDDGRVVRVGGNKNKTIFNRGREILDQDSTRNKFKRVKNNVGFGKYGNNALGSSNLINKGMIKNGASKGNGKKKEESTIDELKDKATRGYNTAKNYISGKYDSAKKTVTDKYNKVTGSTVKGKIQQVVDPNSLHNKVNRAKRGYNSTKKAITDKYNKVTGSTVKGKMQKIIDPNTVPKRVKRGYDSAKKTVTDKYNKVTGSTVKGKIQKIIDPNSVSKKVKRTIDSKGANLLPQDKYWHGVNLRNGDRRETTGKVDRSGHRHTWDDVGESIKNIPNVVSKKVKSSHTSNTDIWSKGKKLVNPKKKKR